MSHFRGKYPYNNFVAFFGKFKTPKFCSEIIWPLEYSYDFLNGIYKFWFSVIRINAKDIISNDESKSKLWWGPFPFVFDNVTFYQLVYKKTDIDAPWNEVCIIFLDSKRYIFQSFWIPECCPKFVFLELKISDLHNRFCIRIGPAQCLHES